MSEKIVTVQRGRGTWQGPESEAPRAPVMCNDAAQLAAMGVDGIPTAGDLISRDAAIAAAEFFVIQLGDHLALAGENAIAMHNTAKAIASAIRALPAQGQPAAPAVKVKALVWSRGIVDYAKPLPGMKYIACSTTPTGSWAFWLEDAPETRAVFGSEDAAKAAAQADYEARILAALEPHA